ncbi:hypothetical protein Bbelb_245340 [Branchiostoma belcheri]|nr:hypothetical protein Bbelb_245340 [Branchiostoma belcheri]
MDKDSGVAVDDIAPVVMGEGATFPKLDGVPDIEGDSGNFNDDQSSQSSDNTVNSSLYTNSAYIRKELVTENLQQTVCSSLSSHPPMAGAAAPNSFSTPTPAVLHGIFYSTTRFQGHALSQSRITEKIFNALYINIYEMR